MEKRLQKQALLCGYNILFSPLKVCSWYRKIIRGIPFLWTNCIIRNCSLSTRARTHTHTNTHTQPFHSSLDFVQDNSGELVPEETFTHSHLSWSSIIPYLLPPLPVQLTCLTVFFHNFSPSFLWYYLLA